MGQDNGFPSCRKEKTKKWYKAIWLHLINRFVFNLSLLHKLPGGDLTALNFHRTMIFTYDTDVETFNSKSFAVNPFKMIEHSLSSHKSSLLQRKSQMPQDGVRMC